MSKTGARLLVEVLIAQGVTRVFCVPGESYLSVLDALHEARTKIETVVCRHEAAAANMAEARGKLTGRPGIAFVTRGPGATHASIGVHTAGQDGTPMILFVGQVARGDRGRGAFQELDYRAVFGTLAKWAVEIDTAERLPEIVERAFAVAMSGRPGPVVVALPEDMLDDETNAAPGPRVIPPRPAFSPDFAERLRAALEAAERPLLILGGRTHRKEDLAGLQAAAESKGLPIILSFRRKDLIDNRSPVYAGDLGLGPNPKLLERIKSADLVIALGARLGENPTQGYSLFTRAETAARLIHIYPEAEEIGRVWPVRMGAAASLPEFVALLKDVTPKATWRELAAATHRDFEAFSEPVETLGAVNPARIFAKLRAALPENAIIANGAGNYAAWLHRFFPHHAFGTQLAPTSGAMGYGLPAAIAAKLEHPERDVVAVAGDGCFLMSGQELATAVQYRLGLIVLVFDNGSFGTIRMHQERRFPGRVAATDIQNPDFVALARAYGAAGFAVHKDAEFGTALAEARSAAAEGRPALIHLKTDIRDIAPGRRIGP